MPLHLYDGTSAACTKKEMAEGKDAFEAHVNKRICEHMNQDHAASVLAMALALDSTANRGPPSYAPCRIKSTSTPTPRLVECKDAARNCGRRCAC